MVVRFNSDFQEQLAEGQLFLTERDLALRWNVSVKKLQADRLSGRGVQFVRFGRSIRYRLSDLEAFEEINTRRSTSDEGASS